MTLRRVSEGDGTYSWIDDGVGPAPTLGNILTTIRTSPILVDASGAQVGGLTQVLAPTIGVNVSGADLLAGRPVTFTAVEPVSSAGQLAQKPAAQSGDRSFWEKALDNIVDPALGGFYNFDKDGEGKWSHTASWAGAVQDVAPVFGLGGPFGVGRKAAPQTAESQDDGLLTLVLVMAMSRRS